MPRVVLDSGKPLDDLGNSRQRPQACLEAMSLRPKTQRGVYLGQLFSIESGLASSAPRSFERLEAPLEETEDPSAYALTADAK